MHVISALLQFTFTFYFYRHHFLSKGFHNLSRRLARISVSFPIPILTHKLRYKSYQVRASTLRQLGWLYHSSISSTIDIHRIQKAEPLLLEAVQTDPTNGQVRRLRASCVWIVQDKAPLLHTSHSMLRFC